jgi:hypothetical protein
VTEQRNQPEQDARGNDHAAEESRPRHPVCQYPARTISERERSQSHGQQCRLHEQFHTEHRSHEPRADDLNRHDQRARDEDRDQQLGLAYLVEPAAALRLLAIRGIPRIDAR